MNTKNEFVEFRLLLTHWQLRKSVIMMFAVEHSSLCLSSCWIFQKVTASSQVMQPQGHPPPPPQPHPSPSIHLLRNVYF